MLGLLDVPLDSLFYTCAALDHLVFWNFAGRVHKWLLVVVAVVLVSLLIFFSAPPPAISQLFFPVLPGKACTPYSCPVLDWSTWGNIQLCHIFSHSIFPSHFPAMKRPGFSQAAKQGLLWHSYCCSFWLCDLAISGVSASQPPVSSLSYQTSLQSLKKIFVCFFAWCD